jgi:hypothetical protein
MTKTSKRERREVVRAQMAEWSRLAFPDASEIPEDPEAGAALQRRADRMAAEILEKIATEGLI